MSIQYGSLYVDEQCKATVLPNLFYKTWLVPGVADFKFDSSNGAAYFSIVLYDTLENVIVTTNEEII